MAITTLDGVIAGMKAPESLVKVGTATEAAGVLWTPYYTAGVPGAGTANAAGINGRAVTPSLITGEINRVNPGSGNSYLARFAASCTVIGTIYLVDRLWENSALSVTSTSAQAITPAALPARDNAGSTNGAGVLFGCEWSAAGGASSGTVTLTYTDQDGNTGATGTFVPNNTPVAGTVELFGLAAGDWGVRVPTSYIASATRTSGTMHLVGYRILAALSIPQANVTFALDALTSGMPQIFNDSCLQLLFMGNATTAPTITGMYIETQG